MWYDKIQQGKGLLGCLIDVNLVILAPWNAVSSLLGGGGGRCSLFSLCHSLPSPPPLGWASPNFVLPPLSCTDSCSFSSALVWMTTHPSEKWELDGGSGNNSLYRLWNSQDDSLPSHLQWQSVHSVPCAHSRGKENRAFHKEGSFFQRQG